MSAAQLTLGMAALPGEVPPERLIAQAAHDETAAMISAVIGAIPMVGHRKGTVRETVQRPVAYLYACRDRLDEHARELAIAICSAVTGDEPCELRELKPWLPRREGQPLRSGTAWLRMNGERDGTRGAGRESIRTMNGTPERDGYAWTLDVSLRSSSSFRASFNTARRDLDDYAPEMLGTLAGWLLVLRWSEALRFVVLWRRRSGCSLGPEMLVRRDQALAAGHVPEAEHAETYRLAQLDPATSMLARSVMAVPPRGDS